MKHIFVVDDEKNIREIIIKYLEKEGYKVTSFVNGNNVLSEMKRLKPDLLVIDIMMPGIDGLELCKQIRMNSDIPIIFVSARDEELDRILGLELGADDYLTKPFSPRELVVRIKNIFKRLDQFKINNHDDLIKIKDLKLHTYKRFVEKDGVELELTTKEYDLFEFLVRNKNIPFTRDNLLEKIWGYDYYAGDRMIDDLIKRIRKKLKDINSLVEITTVWGYGYKIED
ncbi:DNA-binding response regulator [Vulcanibacillus modesticaldus]|uniref:DNA-binding response regulator n=1 Tax=Vulcanibacillus modesticaldus TaxID=337097 RepID=A0A1D2YW64_9BACI|nr:response regulator transcription factor [Vulcanibacillus modesticaldus]OEF99939.1 DNA-binding response regulator [Vulcanibacillus modesticaldus]